MTTPAPPVARTSYLDAIAVYFRPRVLIVFFLGFSSGLPLALSGSTLLYWTAEVGVNLKTIGLFTLVSTPYTIKFFWAPLVDALDVPILGRFLGRRRGWLIFTQILLLIAIVFLGSHDPATAPVVVALGALLVATASATQDIVVDAFRIDSLKEEEQPAGMASYVTAYRVAMLVASAGALYIVSGFEFFGLTKQNAWSASYMVMAALVLIGMATTLVATEPEKSATADATHHSESPFQRLWHTVSGAFIDFFLRENFVIAVVALLFVVLFKLTDSLAGVMTGPFTVDLGFSRNEYATIIKFFGFGATIAGSIAGGYLARALPLVPSLWIGGIVQALANLAFSWQAVVGYDTVWLTFAITVENFTSGLGTVVYLSYLTALCRNPLHTATQYALLTALSAVGRTYISAVGGFIADATGWAWFFVICALAALPSFVLLAWLQRQGHFAQFDKRS